ncbi:Protein CCA1, partial [Tetrabaena socialis]
GLAAPQPEQQQDGLKVKTRKPYIITKQRERWTDDEHARFLEALKLYGRAWRKIEEHVSTKTAVQIRSHAQKFINKLERNKDSGLAEDGENISIPPPRPKRKPSRPYPRKDFAGPDNSGSGVADASGVNGGSGTFTCSQGTGLNYQQQSKLSLPTQPRSTSLLPPTDVLEQPHLPLSVSLQQPRTLSPELAVAAAAAAAIKQHQLQQIVRPQASLQSAEVTEATVAAVAAAASAAAAAAAAAVVAAAGQQVQAHLQAHPPQGFPFFGMPPSLLAQITLQNSPLEGMSWGNSGGGGGAYGHGGGDSAVHARTWEHGTTYDRRPHLHHHHHHHHHHHSLERQQQQQLALAEATATTTDADNPVTMMMGGSAMTRGRGISGGQESRGSDGNSAVTEREGEGEEEDLAQEDGADGDRDGDGEGEGDGDGEGDLAGLDAGGEDQAAQSHRADGKRTNGVSEADADRFASYWHMLGVNDDGRLAHAHTAAAAAHAQREGHHGHDHPHGHATRSLGTRTTSSGGGGRAKAGPKAHAHKEGATSSRDQHKAARDASPSYSDMVNRDAGGKPAGRGVGSSDTNGSDSALRETRNDTGVREAQGSNPSNHNNGNGSSGNGSGSNGNGSRSQGHGSQGNGDGSSGNGHSGGSGGEGAGGSGGDGNGYSLKASHSPHTKHHHHHHHHVHAPPHSQVYDAGRYPSHHETQDRDGNGASGIGVRPLNSEDEGNTTRRGCEGSGAATPGAGSGGEEGGGGSQGSAGGDGCGRTGCGGGSRAGSDGGPSAGPPSKAAGRGSGAAALSGGGVPRGGGGGARGTASGLTGGGSLGSGGGGAPRPEGALTLVLGLDRPPVGQVAGSAFSVPPPSAMVRGASADMGKVTTLLAQLQSHASLPLFPAAAPGVPPVFAQQPLLAPAAAAQQAFYASAAATASAMQLGLLGVAQLQAQAGQAAPLALAKAPAAAAASLLPGASADARAALAISLAQVAAAPLGPAAAAAVQLPRVPELAELLRLGSNAAPALANIGNGDGGGFDAAASVAAASAYVQLMALVTGAAPALASADPFRAVAGAARGGAALGDRAPGTLGLDSAVLSALSLPQAPRDLLMQERLVAPVATVASLPSPVMQLVQASLPPAAPLQQRLQPVPGLGMGSAREGDRAAIPSGGLPAPLPRRRPPAAFAAALPSEPGLQSLLKRAGAEAPRAQQLIVPTASAPSPLGGLPPRPSPPHADARRELPSASGWKRTAGSSGDEPGGGPPNKRAHQ